MVDLSFLQIHTNKLDRSLVSPGGLFRLYYGLRNPPQGMGLGLDGVESEELVRLYAAGLDRTAALFRGWGWAEPRRDSEGHVPVYVFRTDRLGRGDCPLTFTNEVMPGQYVSLVTLRSTIDEPRADARVERAAVEAAHEAAHVFTHQFTPRVSVLGPLWKWFDEATAVFVENEAFPQHQERLRAALYWDHCPEASLTTTQEGFGGYFAAWFVRFLVGRYGSDLLLKTWAGSEGRLGPVAVLVKQLAERGANFSDVFWEYCWRGYDPREVAPGAQEQFGPRSLTAAVDSLAGDSGASPLAPLSCRYYRLLWEGDAERTPLCVVVEGSLPEADLRVALLRVGTGGRVLDSLPLEPRLGTSQWYGEAVRPQEGHTAVAIARCAPPLPGRRRPVSVRLTLGMAVPGVPFRSLDLNGTPVSVPEGFEDATDYSFRGEDESRLTLLTTPPSQAETPSQRCADYQARVEAFLLEAVGFERPRLATPAPEAAALAFTFTEGEQEWTERTAFLRLEDGSGLQVSVVAPARSEEAEDWFTQAVQGARAVKEVPPPDPAAGRAFVPAGMSAAGGGFVSRRVGSAVVPVPAELRPPPRFALVAHDGQVRLEVDAEAAGTASGRELGAALGSVAVVPQVRGQAAPGAEEEYRQAKARLEQALQTAFNP